MFARTAFRTFQAAAPLKQTAFRRLASSVPSGGGGGGGGGSNTLLITAAVAAAAGGGYYFYSSGAASGQPAKAATSGADGAGKAAHKAAFTGGEQGFVSLEVESVETVNHNTKQVRFKLPEADSVSGMQAASALLTKFKPEGAEKPVIRPYTAVSDDDAVGHLDLLVKKYEGGPMSTHIHGLQPGQKLDVKVGPIVKYAWAPNKHEHIALVAGGTGITPMYQLLRAVFRTPGADKTKVTLVFANVAEEDILLRRQINELENTFPQQFRAFYVLEKPPSAQWNGTTGYITKELLKQVLPEPASGDIKVFVCGPPPMMKAISGAKKSPSDQGELTGMLKELGYTPEQVLKF